MLVLLHEFGEGELGGVDSGNGHIDYDGDR